ncbi:MAG TPA: diguanylate cyclase [Rhodocyclaceae bacterium]|nr:diguanylate cyclase [Rhodocyclaceae bacterium]
MLQQLRQPSFLIQWVILALGLATLGGATGFNLYVERGRTEEREEVRLLGQARVIQENLEHNLSSVSWVLADLRRDLPLLKTNGNLTRRLKMLSDAMPGVRTLALLDGGGTVLASSRAELLGQNFALREYFMTPRGHPDPDRIYVSQPFQTSLGIYVVNISLVIPGPRGEFAGIVVATLDPAYFVTLMASVLYAPDMWTAIAHGDGIQFLMVPEREGQPGKNLAQPGSFFSRHRDSGSASNVLTGTVYATGEHRMMAMRTVRPKAVRMDKSLVIAVARDLDAIFAGWRRDLEIQGGLFGLIFIGSILGLYAGQRRQRESARRESEAAAALAASERFMKTVTDNIPGMVAYWTDDLRCRFANHAYLEWFGRTPEQMRGIRIQELMGDELFRKNEPYIRAALTGERQQFERTLVKADGSIGYTWAHYIPDQDGDRVRGFFVLVSDITELKRAQISLAESESKLKAIIEAEPECVKILAPDGTLLQINRAGLDILEAESDAQVIGSRLVDVVTAPYREAFDELTRKVCRGESGSLEFEMVGLKGQHRWLDTHAVPMRDASGGITGLLGVTRDMTARRQVEQELARLAQTDPLTGLANRRHFMAQAEEELSRSHRYGGPLSVLMVDIDHFKRVNDTYGHKTGDLVLRRFAEVSRHMLRDIDTIGRIGGEEFAILLPETDGRRAREVAERLRGALAEAEVPVEQGLPLRFTASIGIASLAGPRVNIDTLLNQADQALYEAKHAGRNKVRAYEGGGAPAMGGAGHA